MGCFSRKREVDRHEAGAARLTPAHGQVVGHVRKQGNVHVVEVAVAQRTRPCSPVAPLRHQATAPGCRECRPSA